jgi:YgiT-type zinc finger domain-containing protein
MLTVPERPLNNNPICPVCEHGVTERNEEEDRFKYNNGDRLISVVARVPVWSCVKCGFRFTDHTAEDIRHEAVCHAIGRLTPREHVQRKNK